MGASSTLKPMRYNVSRIHVVSELRINPKPDIEYKYSYGNTFNMNMTQFYPYQCNEQ